MSGLFVAVAANKLGTPSVAASSLFRLVAGAWSVEHGRWRMEFLEHGRWSMGTWRLEHAGQGHFSNFSLNQGQTCKYGNFQGHLSNFP